MDQLLGALGPELEAHEAEEGSDSDDDAVSGTDQGAVPNFLELYNDILRPLTL